ncbi:MAG: HD-GYP domain-containing protein [Acidobacteria bacterium]|nr:HD-GYP domain-containing protein [Acidobacteriota bacterium]
MIESRDIEAHIERAVQPLRYRINELENKHRRQAVAMASSLVSLVDLRDSYTGGHSGRVAQYCAGIAAELDLAEVFTETLVFAGLLHDIGKVGVPDHILLKKGPLTEAEFDLMKKHPEFGWTALANIEEFEEIGLIVLHHHEHYDGKGYPAGLSGNEIPLGSRIITVADSYDALTTDRPYRTARTKAQAIAEIERCAGTHFDAHVAEAFLNHIGRRKSAV